MSTSRHTIQGWLTQPTTQGRPSEGHTSAVNVLRMVNSRHQHQAAEPVPFRAQPAPLRAIKPPRKATPATGCTHDCHQGDRCTCAPKPRGTRRSLRTWLVALVVFGLVAGAMALLGTPHDQ